MSKPAVLVSWIAVKNDPFEREPGDDANLKYRRSGGERVPGPTLTLLFDEESTFKGRVQDVVLLRRRCKQGLDDRERIATEETIKAIHAREPRIEVHVEHWDGENPTDHKAIFSFLRHKVPELRERFRGRELVVHASPGTASMHTVWVLMAETGFIEQPFQLVQSYRKEDRRGGPAIVPIKVGIETFYTAYMESQPPPGVADEEQLKWDPAKFRSKTMKDLYTEARRFARISVPVLLMGERGTGKTTLASWIRLQSPFKCEALGAHWPVVPCGQYSGDTMRAELFGHTKGAFTGADRDKEGLLARADGDTLFLDEIGDVSPDVQRLLIKALEEGEFLPLGSGKPKKSRFRLLSATNLDDNALRDKLDPDFLDRISVLSLRLPPLREINEELPWLWESTLKAATTKAGILYTPKLEARHHARVVKALAKHPLPGNLRDLFRVAYRLVAATSDPLGSFDPDDAIDYALQDLFTAGFNEECGGDQARLIARAFAQAEPLDPLIDHYGALSVASLEENLRVYLARQLRRVADERSTPVDELCDRSERTLRGWAHIKGRGSAAERQDIAAVGAGDRDES